MDAFLVEPQWLEERLGDPGVVILDCSWYIPELEKSARAEFEQEHIPGARFFDLDKGSDETSPYVNMLPSAQRFAEVARELGIGNDSLVVVYDSSYVSARVWWMFRIFGHEKVRVLNGGWKRWKAEGRPVEQGPAEQPPQSDFIAREPIGQVATWRDVLDAIQNGGAVVADARTTERFIGELPSGYPGVAGGHMPGAINVPWGRMIPQKGDFTFVSPEEAEAIFRDAGVDIERPVITTCGSGVTAAILAFQLARLGKTDWKIYDGSWHEWGQRDDLPKESI
ncbi:sulfurtransferase [Chelativorans sp. Marseille-P2723]|uniref:sulfurtransferase n=1 Tax=Chelativorans sp. Marseille-P2723 TaxID=2709133 RepID=UPI0015708694|nr:sulfurtransferase [Chelativorans sp. Marseille-P2723]